MPNCIKSLSKVYEACIQFLFLGISIFFNDSFECEDVVSICYQSLLEGGGKRFVFSLRGTVVTLC